MVKNIFLWALLGVVCVVAACSKDEPGAPQYEGETYRLDCFNRIGLKAKDNKDSTIFIIPDELMPDEFEQEGVAVSFDAELRPNELPPSFPDPSLNSNSLFQGKVENIRRRD